MHHSDHLAVRTRKGPKKEHASSYFARILTIDAYWSATLTTLKYKKKRSPPGDVVSKITFYFPLGEKLRSLHTVHPCDARASRPISPNSLRCKALLGGFAPPLHSNRSQAQENLRVEASVAKWYVGIDHHVGRSLSHT